MTCSTGHVGPPTLIDPGEHLAAGILLLVTDHVDIGATGVLTASANAVSALGGSATQGGTTVTGTTTPAAKVL